MALLPTQRGLRWFPTDASVTNDGRPLHAGQRPSGHWKARKPAQQRPVQGPDWTQKILRKDKKKQKAQIRSYENAPEEVLEQLVIYLQQFVGEQFLSEGELRKICKKMMTTPEGVREFLELFKE